MCIRDRALKAEEERFAETLDSVSYTHLDVYKRQAVANRLEGELREKFQPAEVKPEEQDEDAEA